MLYSFDVDVEIGDLRHQGAEVEMQAHLIGCIIYTLLVI